MGEQSDHSLDRLVKNIDTQQSSKTKVEAAQVSQLHELHRANTFGVPGFGKKQPDAEEEKAFFDEKAAEESKTEQQQSKPPALNRRPTAAFGSANFQPLQAAAESAQNSVPVHVPKLQVSAF